jgi:hypothetical protein
MLLDLLVLLGREPLGLRDHGVAHADLADVVEQARDVDALDHVLREVHLARDLRRVYADRARSGRACRRPSRRPPPTARGSSDVRGAQLLVLLGELLGAVAHLALEVAVHVLELEVLLARDLVQPLDLGLEVGVVERLAQRRAQLVVVPRLRDQPVDLAAVDRVDRDLHLRVAGQHHAHDVGLALAHVGEEVDARHLGHALVGHHDLGRVLLEHVERLAARLAHRTFMSSDAQQPLQRLEDVHFVVDEEDGVFVAHGSSYQVSCQGALRSEKPRAARC